MNQIIQSIKKTIAKKDFDAESLVAQLKELREFIKTNLDEPGFVRMVRLAYENIEENGTYTFEYTEGEDPKANLGYLIDLLILSSLFSDKNYFSLSNIFSFI
jgi:hypothetical protein